MPTWNSPTAFPPVPASRGQLRPAGGSNRRLGLAGLGTLRRSILPDVRRELDHWTRVAAQEPDARVRALALDSVLAKRFHCEGGAVFALLVPEGSTRRTLVRAICAIQTLSDVLDSLTDRPPGMVPLTSGQIMGLHGAFVGAVTGLGLPPEPDTGSKATAGVPLYVRRLVGTATASLRRLPRLTEARPLLLGLGLRYAVMQALKHGPRADRRWALGSWARRLESASASMGPRPWAEAAACAGSTLGMFRLLAWAGMSRTEDPEPAAVVLGRYCPSVCALHILLDGAIDLREDAASDDLNVFRAWTEPGSAPGPLGDLLMSARRLEDLSRQARRGLRGDRLGRLLVDGLWAAYLSDPKVPDLPGELRRRLLRSAGPRGWFVRSWIALHTRTGVLAGRVAQVVRGPGEEDRSSRSPGPGTRIGGDDSLAPGPGGRPRGKVPGIHPRSG